MSQTNTSTNNGQNRNQISVRGGRGRGGPSGSSRGNYHNSCRNNSIAKYSFEGKKKDGPLFKLTITETGHRPSQFRKISDALPVLCTDKNYRGLDEVIRTGSDRVETDFMSDYPNDNQWFTTHHVQIITVNPEADAEPDGSRPVLFLTME